MEVELQYFLGIAAAVGLGYFTYKTGFKDGVIGTLDWIQESDDNLQEALSTNNEE